MHTRLKPLAAAAPVLGVLMLTTHFSPTPEASTPILTGTTYKVVAKNARRNFEVQGTPTVVHQGVPAEPVDTLCWDGEGSEYLVDAVAVLEVDPVNDQGSLRARWTDEFGTWTYTQTLFVHPEHASGVQLGPSVNDTMLVINDPVVTNAYLHGDTGAAPPALPTVFALIATWGPASVTLNGQPFLNTFDGPANQGLWGGHTMATAGARDPDGTVRTVTGGIYNLSQASVGRTDNRDLEFHMSFHDERFPLTTNIPPLFEFNYHMVFEDVSITIEHVEPPPAE